MIADLDALGADRPRNYLFRDRRRRDGPSLAAFWGPPQDAEEEALHVPTRERHPAEAPVRKISA